VAWSSRRILIIIHSLPTSSSRPAEATTNTAAMGENIRESIARTPPPLIPLFNLHEYFQPVFDQLDKLNKMLDSHMEEEEKMINPTRKRNDDSTVSDAMCELYTDPYHRNSLTKAMEQNHL
jgi:hypothetical protein